MKRNQSQFFSTNHGRSSWGFNITALSLSLLLLGMLLVVALSSLASYMECLTVRCLITRAAEEHDLSSDSGTDLRVRIGKIPNTSQVRDTRIDDTELHRVRGVIVIDANYEQCFPLFWILNGVFVFDDLIVETQPGARA